MSRADLTHDACTVARAAELLGDAWTLLVLRELFLGQRRFDAIQRQTGASPPLLSQRLKRLEAEGIVARRPYSVHPPRDEYRLTAKGRELWPVVVALKGWGDRWCAEDGAAPPPMRLRHAGCGAPTTPRMVCEACGEPMDALSSVVEYSDDWAAARAARGAPARKQPTTRTSKGETP